MAMVKKLGQMANKIIIFCLIGLLFSCKESSKKEINSDRVVKKGVKVQKEENSFKPDMTINNQITLMKPCDFLENTMRYNDRVFLKNKSNTQYLILGINYGEKKNQFKEAEITNDLNFEQYFIQNDSLDFYTLDTEIFKTDSSIQLGMNKQDIINIKGLNFREIEDGISYILEYPNSKILKEYNMPIYYARFYFKENVLVKYSFGFETP